MKGVHGSTYFTLSLPVSRLRLLGVRTAMGLLELLGATLLCAAALRFLLPVMLPELSFATLDFVRYAFTMFACLTAFLSIATLLSTFLDEMWSAWGTMLIAAGLGVLASYLSVPDNINPFRVIGPAGPLVTHTIPWVAMAISVAVAVGMWIAAATVVQKRDY
jgi:hypothetical protein